MGTVDEESIRRRYERACQLLSRSGDHPRAVLARAAQSAADVPALLAEVERLRTELRDPGNDLLDAMTERSPLIIKRTAIEVVREGRFSYVVVERMDSGLDRTWEPPHWFRWTAERQARRLANPNWYEPQTVLRIEVSA